MSRVPVAVMTIISPAAHWTPVSMSGPAPGTLTVNLGVTVGVGPSVASGPWRSPPPMGIRTKRVPPTTRSARTMMATMSHGTQRCRSRPGSSGASVERLGPVGGGVVGELAPGGVGDLEPGGVGELEPGGSGAAVWAITVGAAIGGGAAVGGTAVGAALAGPFDGAAPRSRSGWTIGISADRDVSRVRRVERRRHGWHRFHHWSRERQGSRTRRNGWLRHGERSRPRSDVEQLRVLAAQVQHGRDPLERPAPHAEDADPPAAHRLVDPSTVARGPCRTRARTRWRRCR